MKKLLRLVAFAAVPVLLAGCVVYDPAYGPPPAYAYAPAPPAPPTYSVEPSPPAYYAPPAYYGPPYYSYGPSVGLGFYYGDRGHRHHRHRHWR